MADEENPLGGGPFGVGPFGPLVATAAAAVAVAMTGASVTTSQVSTRTLYYQAKVFVAAPDEVLNPPVAAAKSFSITTGQVFSRTLHYQSYAKPIYAPPAEVAAALTVEWIAPLSRAPSVTPRILAQNYLPFVPPLAPVVTADEWLPRWRGPPSYVAAPAGGSPFVPKEAVLENTQTPDKWLPSWRGPPNYNPAPTGGSPFIPKEATRENTVTPDAWMPRWQKAVPSPRLNLSDVTYTQPPAAVANLTTTLEWMPAWSGTKRPLLPLAAGVVNVPLPSNLTTTLEWQTAWRGPPRVTPAPQGGSPFVPKEAVLENTATPDKWLARWQAAVPVPPVHHTQPFLGYPYAAASNLTTTLEWMPAWRGPPSYTPIKVQTPPFIPKADVVNQVTPDKWLQAWRGPPRAVPAQAGGSPFVPKEAVLENTQTPDKWLVRFAKAVPTPKPVPTQPVFGYPYEVQAIVVPYEQWWHQPLSRAPARPSVHAKPYQPFVPKEAVAENTQTPDKWLQRWQGPPAYRPIKVQTPPFVYSPPPPVTLTTTLEWQQPLSVAVKKRPVRHTQPTLYLPEVVVTAEVAEAESFPVTWSRAFRKTLFYQAKIAPAYTPAFVENTVTPDKWLKPLGIAAKRPAVWHTQPFLGYPYGTQVEGGPAEEPERVICLLEHSRVVVVPEALRTATVLVSSRVAVVPEASRTVEALFSDREEDSNLSQTLPCGGPPGDAAFQDDAFQDDAFQ